MRAQVEKPIQSFEDAQRFIRGVLPGAVCRKQGGWCCQVVGADGTILGAASNWLEACRAACRPLLEAKERERLEAIEAQQRDAADFLMFLRKHLAKEFMTWKTERDAADKAALEVEKAKLQAVQAEATGSCPVHPGAGGERKSIGLFPVEGETADETYAKWSLRCGNKCTHLGTCPTEAAPDAPRILSPGDQ